MTLQSSRAVRIDQARASSGLDGQERTSTRPKTEPEAQEAERPLRRQPASRPERGSSALSGLVNTNAINARKAPQETLRISQGVSQGLIVKRVQPVYPAQARQMRLEGKVELQANISKSGSITGVKQLSGNPLLGRAATDAVRQWKYKPYFLNGEPVEIQTQITVNFQTSVKHNSTRKSPDGAKACLRRFFSLSLRNSAARRSVSPTPLRSPSYNQEMPTRRNSLL